MTELRLRSYLVDIYEQSENIMQATERMSYEEYLKDPLYNAGIIRFFEIIGEAAKHVPDDFTNIRKYRGERYQDFVTG